ncbi:MAG: hypothetical protein M0R32_11630 [Candidatus Cloacimonetes bacterium]|jgi:hypothetical protein|nr:hypothetical protein [Candidatus Cloacimonadota bacterium]
MNKDQKFEKEVLAAQEADKKIRFCAFYKATKGMTTPALPGDVMKLFSELKIRLKKGSWESLSHMRSYILAGENSVPKEMRK